MLRVMRIDILKLLDGINSLPACCMDSAYLVCLGWPQDALKSDLPFIVSITFNSGINKQVCSMQRRLNIIIVH